MHDAPIGHNGGPRLNDEPAPIGTKCRLYRQWNPPGESEEKAYEMWKLGLSGKRVKRPTGTCDRVLIGRRESFGATAGEHVCKNYAAKPAATRPQGGGFITIWRDGRVIWQGSEDWRPTGQNKRKWSCQRDGQGRLAGGAGNRALFR